MSLFLLSFLLGCGRVLGDRIGVEQTSSAGHPVSVSVSNSPFNAKWISFPQQKELHARFLSQRNQEISTLDKSSKVVNYETFWDDHRSLLEIPQSTEMKLKKVRPMKHGIDTGYHAEFDQIVDSVKVYGGEFRVTVGGHKGVVNAHGLPFRHNSKRDYSSTGMEQIKSRVVDENLQNALFRSVEQHVRISQGIDVTVTGLSVDLSSADGASRPIELVWYSPNAVKGEATEGSWTLSYFLNGVRAIPSATSDPTSFRRGDVQSGITESANVKVLKSSADLPKYLIYDVFINADSLSVINLFDKTSRYSSPFTSPLDRNIEVTDETSGNVVFDSSSQFPTSPSDDEIDLLVTTTMYVSNLMFSLSGGFYETWAQIDTKLNIEYKLSIANAYFDGYWGIHFGTGFITDDVVGHEWGHGYMETATQSLYHYQPGAMDEAFADILGESIDILNGDTADVNSRSHIYPPVCTTEKGGSDNTNRWSMGEDVTAFSGGLRDMYAPTCHFDPDTTYSPNYYCGNSDSGGVHWNSGVVNRLFSVLVDGGVYGPVPGQTGNVPISGIGMTKALNLFWTAYQELTPTAQFVDLATALKESCQLLIGADLYDLNLLSPAFTVSSSTLTVADCAEVEKGITQSGMDETDVCPSENLARSNCASSALLEDQIANEAYSKDLASYYYNFFGCHSAGSTVYRVFDYATLGLANEDNSPLTFNIECIEFAYLLTDTGTATFTIDVYIDQTGGNPDMASLVHVGSSMADSVSYSEDVTKLFTVTPSSPIAVTLPDTTATVVVALTINTGTDIMIGRGQYNPSAVGTPQETFGSGPCSSAIIYPMSVFNNAWGYSSFNNYQWYVQLTKSLSSFSPTIQPTVLQLLPTIQPSVSPLFPPQVVEFGNKTSIAVRRRPNTWIPDTAFICPESSSYIKRLPVLSLKSIIQSPGHDTMNLIVDVQHSRGKINRNRAFLQLHVVRRGATDVTVFSAEQNLFEETAMLHHFIPPVNTTTDAVNEVMKIGLQVNFPQASITPLDDNFEARISIGIMRASMSNIPQDLVVYDCAYVKNVGVVPIPVR